MAKKRKVSSLASGRQTFAAPLKKRCRVALKPCRRSPLWLDAMPPEVSARIAAYVSGGKQTESALHLAQTNRTQRHAVLTALSHSFKFDATDDADHWAAVFGRDVRSVNFADSGLPFLDPAVDPLWLFDAPELRRAVVEDDQHVLRALAASKSVRELTVRFTQVSSLPRVMDALRRLKLDKLELFCTIDTRQWCPLKRLAASELDKEEFQASCRNVSELRVSCVHCDPLWAILARMPSVKAVTVGKHVPDAALLTLQGIESVGIRHGSYRLALKLGLAVTCLTTSKYLNAAQLRALCQCSRITQLEVGVAEGAEGALVDVVRSIPSIRTLKLRWPNQTGPAQRECKWYPECAYHKPSPDVLQLVVECAPDLVELSLGRVRVCYSELNAILKRCGPRLQYLEISIADQDEAPFDRLEAVIAAATRYCPELRHCSVFEAHLKPGVHDTGFSAKRLCLLAMLKRLKCRAPLLDDSSLKAHIDRLIWDTWSSVARGSFLESEMGPWW